LIEELLAAWGDWLDEDDGIRVDGAENEYYLSLPTPYLPRQGPFETVEELLLIRGFDAFFGNVNLSAAFTLYSDSDLVNLNTATREALALLPGLDSEAIDAIVASRREQDFTDFLELEDILEDDDLTELQPWVDFGSLSQVYTILVVPARLLEAAEGEAEPGPQPRYGGFAKTIRVADYTERPQVLRVDPMPRLPKLDAITTIL
jgi:general secretion pathway protein K